MCLSLFLSLSFFFFSFFFVARTYDSTKERHASIGRVSRFLSVDACALSQTRGSSLDREGPSGPRHSPLAFQTPSVSNRFRVFCPFITKSITEARAKRAASRQAEAPSLALVNDTDSRGGSFFSFFSFLFFPPPSPPPPSFFSFFNLEAFRPSLRARDAIVSRVKNCGS